MYNKKIAILIGKSDEQHFRACMESLQGIKCPTGYQLDVHVVPQEQSFSAQMNAVTAAISAKYKIYIDDHLYMVSPDFIRDILDIFTDKGIGMIGFLGSHAVETSAWTRVSGDPSRGQGICSDRGRGCPSQ